MRNRTAAAATAALACVAVLAACSSAAEVANSAPPQPPSRSTSTATGPGDSSTTPPTGPTDTTGGLPDGFGAGPPGHGLSRFYQQQINWTDCGGGFTCADIWVPLDYDDPDGRAITLKAKLNPADDQATKLGSLFINPGGPGGSGIDYVENVDYDDPITNAYDVIGFDPRGVASSTPVDCVSDSALDSYLSSDPDPDTPDEVTEYEQEWSTFVAGCVDRSGPLLGHVSTIEVARDLDVMRAVVGDPKLNYFGASYGTFIGATYAALFPRNVGRMVLDGAIDPLASSEQGDLSQAVGFETALTAYLTYCVDKGDCPLGDNVDDARQVIIDLLSRLDSDPLPTDSGRPLTEGLAFYGVILPLYSRTFWDYLTSAMQQVVDGDGTLLLALSDTYTERSSDGTYPSNQLEAQAAVDCLDHPGHETVAQIEASEPRFTKASPVFGPVAAWFPYACSNWPKEPTQPQPDYSAKGAAPIVVVGTTRDPATPYHQAVRLSEELDSGVLLSRDGDGHTAYGSGNTCIDEAIDAYLADGTVPADRTRCADEGD